MSKLGRSFIKLYTDIVLTYMLHKFNFYLKTHFIYTLTIIIVYNHFKVKDNSKNYRLTLNLVTSFALYYVWFIFCSTLHNDIEYPIATSTMDNYDVTYMIPFFCTSGVLILYTLSWWSRPNRRNMSTIKDAVYLSVVVNVAVFDFFIWQPCIPSGIHLREIYQHKT